MSAHASAAPRTARSVLHVIAAPVARLLQRSRREPLRPHDWREIERFRIELELMKAHIAVTSRFKIM